MDVDHAASLQCIVVSRAARIDYQVPIGALDRFAIDEQIANEWRVREDSEVLPPQILGFDLRVEDRELIARSDEHASQIDVRALS